MKKMSLLLAMVLAIGFVTSAKAEMQFSIYGGANFAPHSDVTLKDGGVNRTDHIAWDGKSFGKPPYWGVRGTYWFDDNSTWANWGVSLDYMHAKVYADLDGQFGQVYNKLEFSDGLNLLMANITYRHKTDSAFTPYGGVGVGLSIPHVEVQTVANPNTTTFEYQLAGVAVQALAGVEYNLNENWSLFGEYKMNYATIDADLDTGGSLETNVLTNHVNVGLSYRF